MKVLIIGETCRDVFIYGTADRLSPEAPVPVFSPTKEIQNPGMAMNVYKNISAIDSSVEVKLLTNSSWKEISKTRYIDETNHMFMRLDENDNQYGKCDLTGVDVESYDVIVISDYDKGFLSTGQIREVSSRNSNTFLDTKKILGTWCHKVRFIKINQSEFKRTRNCLSDTICQKLIVTEGPRGARHKGSLYPVKDVQRKDSAGAGDTFLAGLAYKFAKTKDIEASIEFANECATTVVQKRGVNTI